MRTFLIKDYFGEEIEVVPQLFLYGVTDFMEKEMPIIGIEFYTMNDGELTPYSELTLCFGEFIGTKNVAYIDTNNCDFAPQLLNAGVAKDTGFTKRSGFCTYPLWVFEEAFLREIGNEAYQQYSDAFDNYMNAVFGE